MPAYRFPILVCEDFAGRFTACAVEDAGAVAVGASYADAVGRLKRYLEWRYRKEPWRGEPGFLDPALVWVRVDVRPEYAGTDRKYPVPETVAVRVPCVRGRDPFGLSVCALPTLGLRFDFYEEAAFRGLVTHYVQGALEGKTPQALNRYLAPGGATADDLIVHVPHKLRHAEAQPQYPTLDAVAEPVGSRALRGRLSRPWERDAEVTRLVRTLLRERASVLLVGESGVGKSAVIAEAVRKVERTRPKRGATAADEGEKKLLAAIFGIGAGTGRDDEDDDDSAQRARGDDDQRDGGADDEDAGGALADQRPPGGRRFWLSSAARLIAGMQYLGQWQERVEALITELSGFAGVLCVDNLLDLVRTGGQGPGDSLAAFLVPYLQRGEVRIIGEASPAELDALRRLLPGFADLFHVLTLPPFTRAQATAALGHVAEALRQNLHVNPERGVTDLVFRLFSRFLPYQGFPGPATTFLAGVFDGAVRDKVVSVSRARVLDAFIRHTGLPEQLLRDDVLLDPAAVLTYFRSRVIGQDGPCRAAADLVTTFKAGLNDPNRPVGVLLFAGPTGVGKTELARALSQYLFGHGDHADRRLLRLDMSEYAGPDAAERLVGSPAAGPSDLIKRIRQQPFTVLLLDEIEKAAPEVFDVLLGVFDEGRLTDRFGRLSTFRSAVIVMTSNLGAGAGEPFGLARGGVPAGTYETEALTFFRPEFFNRIDAVVTFAPLDEPTLLAITAKELADLARREGFTRAGLTLAWDDAVVRHLAAAGFDPRYGARPLQRALETLVVTPVARHLVSNPGLRDVTVRLKLGQCSVILVQTEPPPAPPPS